MKQKPLMPTFVNITEYRFLEEFPSYYSVQGVKKLEKKWQNLLNSCISKNQAFVSTMTVFIMN